MEQTEIKHRSISCRKSNKILKLEISFSNTIVNRSSKTNHDLRFQRIVNFNRSQFIFRYCSNNIFTFPRDGLILRRVFLSSRASAVLLFSGSPAWIAAWSDRFDGWFVRDFHNLHTVCIVYDESLWSAKESV